MKKKYIWLLTAIMTFTMIWLIITQGNWISNSLEIREQEFNRAVMKAMQDVVAKIEERETVLQITKETISFSNDSNSLNNTDIDYLQGDDITKQELMANHHKLIVQKKDSDSFKLSDSINNINQTYNSAELKQNIINKIDNKSVFVENIINKLIRKEINIEDRISEKHLNEILRKALLANGIKLPYEFAVKNAQNQYSIKSRNFDINSKHKKHEILLFPNDIFSSKSYLTVIFSKDQNYLLREMTQPILTSIILIIVISLTFSLTIYIIHRQKKLSELKNDFISNMTHELKTPVSTISLASQMLDDKNIVIDKESISGILKIIDDESKRLSFQIEKVLQTSLFEKGRSHMKTELIDIHDIINNATRKMQLRVAEKNGNITKVLNAQNSKIIADELHITNIFHNLLDNALKYSGDTPPSISIGTENCKKGIKISIADNGIGIPAEYRKRIFKKFYRVQRGNRHDVKGFGLGLNYVKKVIEEHGGKIGVENNTPKGSIFKVFLPFGKS